MMLKKSLALVAAVGTLAVGAIGPAQGKLRIGLISTLTGPGAGLGTELKNGWDLGLETVGNQIGGLETEMNVVDDQLKTDTAVTAVDNLIGQHKVHVVAGVL